MSNKQPVIGITMGDPAGIGPEIIVKAMQDKAVTSICQPVVFSDRGTLEREAARLAISSTFQTISSTERVSICPGTIAVQEVSCLDPSCVRYGSPTAESGKAMAAYIISAVEMAKAGKIDAIVTGPISKTALHDAGYNYPGHTEMLAALTGAKDAVMMLAGERLRVVLTTIHCAYTDVPKLLTTGKILKTILITHESLRNIFAGKNPRIAVAALNPHAGEGGLFGDAEKKLIAPAVAEARCLGIDATGPMPADTLFYYAARGKYDVVVCMYHDQGLIPLKLLHFDTGVNVTLGLPIIRTSVDHGTAYDIAGKGIASPASLISAIKTAVQMVNGRAGPNPAYPITKNL
jgi:4-phospho-D-threonate 3-dehydrogenase / 4-phospho-D-erythronate 3-dehydrogenase